MYDNKGNRIAISSVFGWVITSLITSNASNAIALTTKMDIDNTLQKFWELENVQSKTKLEPEDEQAEKHFLATHSRDEKGKYVVELPFNTESPEFGETLHGALKRFIYLMREYISLGHMRKLPPEEIATGKKKHRNYQKIVWREDPSDPINHFQLCTVTYGTSCAPFLAVRVLEQLAVDHKRNTRMLQKSY